ncbi:MAG: histidine--tRNA ligase [Desulfovibrionales bacterium]
MTKIQKIKGFSDLFPSESTTYSFMEQKAREVFTRYGCRELRTPILEKTELFARSIGSETDIVQKEMFTFSDRKGRSMTLRPEATAGVLRACIENGLAARDSMVKFFTIGPMFRYERPQKGRQRQFHQINVEVLGTTAPQADGELLLMLWSFLSTLNLPQITLELNSLGCHACRPGYHSTLTGYLSGLDSQNLCEDCRRRAVTNPLRVLDCKVEGCIRLTRNAPTIADHLCGECRDHFEEVTALLTAAGVPFHLNPRLVRGLDYYVRTTFEIVSGEIGSQSAVAGGGRYDGLVQALGGPDIPGIGFACGMERLSMLMSDVNDRRMDFYLAVLDASALHQGLLLAHRLRGRGYSGEMSFEPRSIKSQLRQANKLGVKSTLILGPEELAGNQVLVKDMTTGVQKKVNQDDIEQALGFIS